MTAESSTQPLPRVLSPAILTQTGRGVWTYAIAAAAAVVALAISYLIALVTGDLVLQPALLAVLVAAWYGGLGPGLLTLAIAVALTPAFAVLPQGDEHSLNELATPTLIVIPLGILTALFGDQGRGAISSLRRSEGRFEAFMTHLPGSAWMKDAEGRYTYANDGAVRTFGSPRHRLYGKRDDEVFPRALAKQFMDNDRVVLNGGHAVQVVETYEREGSPHQSLVVKFPVLDASDGAPFVGGVGIDITDRYRTEQELGKRSEQLQLVIDAVPALVSYIDRDHRYVFNSKTYEEWFGRSRGGIEGQPLAEVLGVGAYEAIRPNIERALAGEVVEFEALVPYQTGSRWIEAKYIPDRDRSGDVVGMFALVLDVTARHRLELERAVLAEVTAHMSESLEVEAAAGGVVAGLVPSFADGAAVYLSPIGETTRGVVLTRPPGAAADQAGIDAADADNEFEPLSTTTYLLPEADLGVAAAFRTGVAELYRRVPADLELPRPADEAEPPLAPTYSTALVLVSPDGVAEVMPPFVPPTLADLDASGAPDESQPAYTSMMFVPVVADGDVLAVIAAWTDASGRLFEGHDLALLSEVARRAGLAIRHSLLYEESRRIAEELRVASNAKDEFLGTVSHELRTPITVILGNASLLANRHHQMDRETVNASLGDLLGQAERLHRVVENVLILSRLESGAGAVEPEPILIARSISQVVAEAQRQQPGRVLRLESSDWGLFALGAESYVHQVLLNYINNAMRYSDIGEPVDISVRLEGDQVDVRVLDRGVGLADEDLEGLFKPFYRSARTPDEIGGMGIGLSVSNRLIEALGGAVWARQREDGGAEFGFSLPAAGSRDPGADELDSVAPTGQLDASVIGEV